jgi:DNA polymerase-3 subunit delta
MPIRADDLQASLNRGLAPIYLVAGPEPLLLQECCDLVRAAARRQGFTERDLIEAKGKFDWSILKETGAAPSLFASRRIVDLRLPTGKPGREGAKVLTGWAANPDPDILLLVSCQSWDASSRKSKWAATLEKAGVRVDIWPVKAAELPRWINRRMHTAGLEPDREASMILAERVEGNLLAAQQEIFKLALIKGSGPVTAGDLLESVADSSRFDAFALAEWVLVGKLGESLRVITGLRRMGVAVQLVVGALTRELRLVEAYRLAMKAGENEFAVFRRLNIWKTRQQPMQNAARRLDQRKLAAAFESLSLIDRQSKGRAHGEPWHGVDRLVRDLCQPSARVRTRISA